MKLAFNSAKTLSSSTLHLSPSVCFQLPYLRTSFAPASYTRVQIARDLMEALDKPTVTSALFGGQMDQIRQVVMKNVGKKAFKNIIKLIMHVI